MALDCRVGCKVVKNMEILKQLLELLFILKNKIYPPENLSKTLDEFYNKLVEHKANFCENCNEFNCKNRQSVSKEERSVSKNENSM